MEIRFFSIRFMPGLLRQIGTKYKVIIVYYKDSFTIYNY